MQKSLLLYTLITLVGLVFIGRLFQLQIVRGESYDPIHNSAVEKKFDYPERGYVYDRNGKLLIANQLSYDVMVQPNKVKPLDLIKSKYDVWVSGLMKWQSDHRATLDVFELRGDILKFYPLLDITKAERDLYIEKYNLPFHPLVSKGYNSIGCKHCTIPFICKSA